MVTCLVYIGRLVIFSGRLKSLDFGNITVVETIHVKTRVAPNVAGEIRIATITMVAEAVIRKPIDCDCMDCAIQLCPVDALEAAPGEA